MTIVSAFLVPGSPLPKLQPQIPQWGALADAVKKAGASLLASQPDVVLVYSTQWFAVLDQLWVTRKRSQGLHVDENWYEYGDLPFDIYSDADLAHACIEQSPSVGVRSRGVDYDQFPIDTGTIVASDLMGIGSEKTPLVIAANNLYHDGETTAKLAQLAVQQAQKQQKKVAVVGIGGLSGSQFRTAIDISQDAIADAAEDQWNQKILRAIEAGDSAFLQETVPTYAKEARVDMGFKHFHWIMGALGWKFQGAKTHAYGPTYGRGAAVVEFVL